VVIADKTVQVGQTTLAFAPNGWTGGSFVSSKPSVASVAGAIGQTAVVSAKAAGSSLISGQGWKAINGATNCSLDPDIVFVEEAPIGSLASITANPLQVCAPKTTGIATIRATSNVFSEGKVYKASGLPDGTTVFTVLASSSIDYTTGDWVKDGTEFRLIAPFDGNKELARLSIGVSSQNCPKAPPVVELKANPGSVQIGRTTNLTWRQVGGPADECHATEGPGFSTGGDVDGADRSAPLLVDSVFGISCSGPGGVDSKSVTVTVIIPPGGGGSRSSWVDNSNTATASGLSVSCGQILATWTKAVGPVDGYRVYYYAPSTDSWRQLVEVPVGSAGTYTVGATTRLGKVVSPPTVDTPYRYRVYTYRGGNEGVADKDAAGSPIAAVPCDSGPPGTGDLSPSNKDIIKIRNVQLSYSTLVDQDSAVGPALPVIEGMKKTLDGLYVQLRDAEHEIRDNKS
jgi:hypothetical protein